VHNRHECVAVVGRFLPAVSTALDPWMAGRAVGGSRMPSACRRSLMPEILRRCKRLRPRLELKVSLPHALAQDVNIRWRGIGMCRLQMCCCHNSLSWSSKRSCSFFPFSKQETFSDSVFIHEFNAGSLQSGLDRIYGLLGNQSSLFFKIDDCR